MVQSSNVLREPTMDEILTSIREKIEEKTHSAVSSSYKDSQSERGAVLSSSAFAEVGRFSNKANLPKAQSPKKEAQPTDLSVQEAMQILAEGIGLLEEPPVAKAAASNAFNAENSALMRQPHPARGESFSPFSDIERSSITQTRSTPVSPVGLKSALKDRPLASSEEAIVPQPNHALLDKKVAANKISPASMRDSLEQAENLRAVNDPAFASFSTEQNNNADLSTKFLDDVQTAVLQQIENGAARVLRTAISAWVKEDLPKLVEKILAEEVHKALKK